MCLQTWGNECGAHLWVDRLSPQSQMPRQPRGSLPPGQELVQGPTASHLHDQHEGLGLADSNEPHDVGVVQLVHDLCLPHHLVLVRLLRTLFQHFDGHVDLLPAVTHGGAPPEPARAWTTPSSPPDLPLFLPDLCSRYCGLPPRPPRHSELTAKPLTRNCPSPKRTGSVSPSPGAACIQ